MGPLHGLKVIEVAGIGPAPMCAMLLADMGADVVRIDRVRPGGLGAGMPPRADLLNRGRRSVALDLKHPDGAAVLLQLAERADALLEGFRPGVMERLGVGPEPCLQRNPALVYGRITGWGQTGPYAQAAGHDLNYIALAGVADAIGTPETPTPPLNLVGDFGGGALYLAFGMVCALLEARTSGQGQVVDAAMVDGVASLTTMMHSLRAMGLWQDGRGHNMLDGSWPFYRTYRTSDDRFVSLAPLEPKFYAEMLQRLGLAEEELPSQHDRAGWPLLTERIAAAVAQRTLAEWEELLAGTDVCFAPVLTFSEVPEHPHFQARGTFVQHHGVVQPGPAPRFSRTEAALRHPPPKPGEHTAEVLEEWGLDGVSVSDLQASGVLR
ncbi:MAG: CoA transferase [Myxococcales bacterium]|nr:CoA transferase [Myxococcales bacterium]